MMWFLDLFKRKFLLTRIYGIPVHLDYSWFIVFILLTWLSANSIPNSLVENYLTKLIYGLSTIVIFFFTVFLHEFAHAFVAIKKGIRVLEIQLHPFGGLAKLRNEPSTPQAEFSVAIAGPIASFLIALIFLGFYAMSAAIETNILTPLFFMLFLLNLMLAVFNLFPGYPLDGGRVLRAFLWHRGMEISKSTVLTGYFGQIIAAVLMIFGIFITVVSRDILSGLWTILIGVFLFNSARKIIDQINSKENIFVENVMELPASVSPNTTVMKFVNTMIPL